MGGQKCPNCKKGMLIRKGKKTKVRCTVCGYWKFRSCNESSRGALVGGIHVEKPEIHPDPEVEGKKESKSLPKIPDEDIPKVEEEREKLYLKDPDYVRKKALHDQMIQTQRRGWYIQKMLTKLRKSGKYSGLGDTIIIDGEVFDIKTGEQMGAETPGIEAEEVE